MTDERSQFEEWIVTQNQGIDADDLKFNEECNFYVEDFVDGAWHTWKYFQAARAALAHDCAQSLHMNGICTVCGADNFAKWAGIQEDISPLTDAEFDQVKAELPATHWARYDLGAYRLGVEAGRKWQAARAAPIQPTCPRCGSVDPKLHPAVSGGGEAIPCPHPFHDLVQRLEAGEDAHLEYAIARAAPAQPAERVRLSRWPMPYSGRMSEWFAIPPDSKEKPGHEYAWATIERIAPGAETEVEPEAEPEVPPSNSLSPYARWRNGRPM